METQNKKYMFDGSRAILRYQVWINEEVICLKCYNQGIDFNNIMKGGLKE